MVTAVKHEWHSHDRQYTIEIDEDLLSEIYPDLDEDEIADKLAAIENGYTDIDEIVSDAYDNDVEIDWQFQYDDCWTDRKGGYEVTYELGDEDSYHSDPEEAPPTHKCTKCRWTGSSYQTLTQHLREDGSVIENYFDTDEEPHSTKDVCPMCDGDTELTEAGVQEEAERKERYARWDREAAEAEEAVPCYSCGAMHKESELPEIKESGYYCPDCQEGWVMMESREEDPVDEEELARALEELKTEFEALSSHTHHCTECDWTGNEADHEKEGICPNCCAYTEKYDS